MVTEGNDRTAQAESGMSLIEVLAALAFVVLLLSSSLTGIVSHSNQRRVHSEQLLAMSACRNTIEFLRGLDISALPGYDGRGFDVPGQDGQPRGLSPLPNDPDGLPGEISVTVDRTATEGTVYLVVTRVRWVGATRGGDFRMECLLGKRR